MAFSDNDKRLLMQAKMVGPKVIERLESVGIDSMKKLAKADVEQTCFAISVFMESTCWKNSPQAKLAIKNAIAVAKSTLG